MSEGLSATEISQEIAAHAAHTAHERRDRLLSIVEAVLLSLVALLAAWSGYSAAKWSTESRLHLAESSTARTKASRQDLLSLELRNFDSSTFNAWFSAYTAQNEQAMAIAERRFRPEFRRAFDAWRATNPETNPRAPKGPTYMPQYRQPGRARAIALDKQADEQFEAGADASQKADDYVRTTVFLAVVLFLVGISAHFPLRAARYGLIGLGVVLLVASLVQLAQLDRPPG
ncbi:MAG TPA: hypothetical protein VFP24_01285 [Gaiellaceae bacterium]|nr:hypothetical protein [Gaiellaceae bacterium]